MPAVSGSDTRAPEFYYESGKAYFKSGYYDEAILAFTRSIDLSSSLSPDIAADSYFQRGRVYALTKRSYTQAVSDYTEAIKTAPEIPAYYYEYRGRAFSVLGQNQAAQKDFNQARSLGCIPRQIEYPFDESVKDGALNGVDLYEQYGENINNSDLAVDLAYILLTVENGNSNLFNKIWVHYDQANNIVYTGFFMQGSAFQAYARGDRNFEEIFATTLNFMNSCYPGAEIYGWVQLEEQIADPSQRPLYGVDARYRQVENDAWLMYFVITYFGVNNDGFLGIYPVAVG